MMEVRNFLQALLLQNQKVKEAREKLREVEQESGVHAAGFAERVDGGSGAASLIERITEKREAVYCAYVKALGEVLAMRGIAENLFEALPTGEYALMGNRYILGMKWTEIAAFMGMTERTVRKIHRRIMDDVFHGVMVNYRG